MTMLDLASRLSNLPEHRGPAPWPHHEYMKRWGSSVCRSTSDMFWLCASFQRTIFASYKSLWHRDPEGNWSIHVDGPRLDTACPRSYGAACKQTGLAHLELTWTGSATLQVTMDDPARVDAHG